MPLLDIRPDHLKIVQDILQQNVPEREVWAFGSRAKWLAKEYSDLDLCIVGDTPLSFCTLDILEEAFEDSDLPYKVDVVDWATTSESFRMIIERDRVVVQKVGRALGMTSDWPEVRLENVTLILGDGLHGTPTYDEDGEYFFINGNNLESGRIVINESTKRCREEEYLKYKKDLNDRTILVSINGTLGNVAIYQGEKVILGKSACYFNVNSDVDRDFIRYVVSSGVFQNYIHSLATGSTIKNVSLRLMRNFSFKLPPISIQKDISKILKDIDNKIDLNRRINQTLEAMAQALFKSWFIDFDPVKAKIAAKQEGRDPLRAAMSAISGAGQGRPNAESAGCAGAAKPDAELDALPPEQYEQLASTAALFPDEMEESEFGEIPRGWVFKSVVDIAQFANGKVDASSLNEDVYISTENMLENRAGITRATSLPSLVTLPSFKAGHILVSNIRPYFKKIWMAQFDGGRSPDVLAFEPSNLKYAEFLYNLMYQDSFFEFMTRTAKGAKMPRGDKNAIMTWTFPCPDEAIMIYFSEMVRPHYEHIEILNSENKSLVELRDTLLPKLLSGELSVEALAEMQGCA